MSCLSPAGSVTVGCGGAILNPPLTSCVTGASLLSWLNVNDSAYPPGVLSSLVTMYIKRPAAQSRSARHPTLQSQTHPTHKSLGFRAPGFVPHQSEVSRGGGGAQNRASEATPPAAGSRCQHHVTGHLSLYEKRKHLVN